MADSATKLELYILSDFHPEAVKYAQNSFDCIPYGDPRTENWHSHATAILIKDCYNTEDDLASAPQLRVIGKQGVGLDKIDAEACKRRNVKVCNTPGVNASAVTEMALCLALTVAREVPQMVIRQRIQGEAIRKETVAGMLLSRKTIGVALQTLPELLEVTDVVTLHVPLTHSTKNMIAAPQLKQMKKTAILINTARGGIVNEEDLADALEKGEIWGASFDCHCQEPPTLAKYERLWKCPRFVGTPHIAAATDETPIPTISVAIDGIFDVDLTRANKKIVAEAEANGTEVRLLSH
ncbi:related to D-lactate dehydrogenase [Fusarium fujikuroi]|nr:related to D-lactate dehydrogenase [Fusarium fujikuroi]SCV29459.1 related to D-lactate dehydrogenase [Fusarium fujikuroi]